MDKKITLITGAGSGIGLAITNKFYIENHSLILLVKTLKQKKIWKKNMLQTQLKFIMEIYQKILF